MDGVAIGFAEWALRVARASVSKSSRGHYDFTIGSLGHAFRSVFICGAAHGLGIPWGDGYADCMGIASRLLRWILVVLLAVNGFGMLSTQAQSRPPASADHPSHTIAATMHCHHHHQSGNGAAHSDGKPHQPGQPCGCCDGNGHCVCLSHAPALSAMDLALTLLILPPITRPTLRLIEREPAPRASALRPPIV